MENHGSYGSVCDARGDISDEMHHASRLYEFAVDPFASELVLGCTLCDCCIDDDLAGIVRYTETSIKCALCMLCWHEGCASLVARQPKHVEIKHRLSGRISNLNVGRLCSPLSERLVEISSLCKCCRVLGLK